MKKLMIGIIAILVLSLSFLFVACDNSNTDNPDNGETPTITKCKIYFMVDDSNYSIVETAGNEMISLPSNPTKSDYVFDGWFFDNNEQLTNTYYLNTALTKNVTVNAKFKNNSGGEELPSTYTVTFNGNGGIFISGQTTQIIEQGKSALAPIYEREGYDLSWDNSINNVINDLTINAVWTIKTYVVTFDGGDSIYVSGQSEQTVEYGSVAIAPVFEKTGYILSWDKDFSNIINNLNITAIWLPIDYTINYHLDNGINGSNPITYTIESEPIILLDASKNGYIFYGWYTENTFVNKINKIESGSYGALNLYAKWEYITSDDTSATFNGFTKVNEATYSITVSNATELLNFSEIVKINAKSIWKLTTDIQGNNSVASKIATLPVGNNTYYVLVIAENDNVKLYTMQIRRRPIYAVTFDTNGGSEIESQNIEEDSFAIMPTQPNKTGYSFVDWDYDFESAVVATTTITAIWRVITYDIIYYLFDGINGNNPSSYTIEDSITLENAYDSYFDFYGWYTENTFVNKIEIIESGNIGNITLYACWKFLGGGEGIQDNPYLITTVEHIKKFAQLVNGGNNFQDVHFVLENDINLNNEEWLPIGNNYSNYFCGVFDGKGYSFKNLKITQSVSICGFFGINAGTIKNVTIDDVTMEIAGGSYVGSLVGYNFPNGLILGCVVSGSLIVDSSEAGGLVGVNEGIIENCNSSIVIIANARNCGGITGINNGRIIRSYTTGNIFNYYYSWGGTGGIAGINNSVALIMNSYSTGNISAPNGKSSDLQGEYFAAGGLVGVNKGAITNSYSTGNVSAPVAGGFAGRNSTGTIMNSYSLGNVTAISTIHAYAGGFVGINDNLVKACFSIGNVTAETSAAYSAYAGGFLASGNGQCEYIYRCEESGDNKQIIIRKVGANIYYVASNTEGNTASISDFQSEEWIKENIWQIELQVWSFIAGAFPIINFNYDYNKIIEIIEVSEILKLQRGILTLNYRLTKNIDLENVSWRAISYNYGNFDGDCFVIRNYETTSFGFFTNNSGVIKNLFLEEFEINSHIWDGKLYVGGLVGYNYYGTILNCHVKGNLRASTPTIYAIHCNVSVGGLVGESFYGIISNSSSKTTVSVEFSPKNYSGYAGGLVGKNVEGQIEKSYADADVFIVIYSSNNGGAYAGGLVGANDGYIINCYATGEIIAKSIDGGGAVAGGLVGTNSPAYGSVGTIINCYARGDVNSISNASATAGGLIGYLGFGSVLNSFALGDIYSNTTSVGNFFVGGFVGYCDNGNIYNCFSYEGQKFLREISEAISFDTPNNTLCDNRSISQLNKYSFYKNDIEWDETIWNFSDLDFEAGKYPTLKGF